MLDTLCASGSQRRFYERPVAYASAHSLTADSAGVERENVRLFLQRNRWRACCPSGRVVWPRRVTVSDIVLKYPIWQEPYRAAIIETNPRLFKQKIAGAEQVVILRLKQLENNADHHHELTALTDALSALKILRETVLGRMNRRKNPPKGVLLAVVLLLAIAFLLLKSSHDLRDREQNPAAVRG